MLFHLSVILFTGGTVLSRGVLSLAGMLSLAAGVLSIAGVPSLAEGTILSRPSHERGVL